MDLPAGMSAGRPEISSRTASPVAGSIAGRRMRSAHPRAAGHRVKQGRCPLMSRGARRRVTSTSYRATKTIPRRDGEDALLRRGGEAGSSSADSIMATGAVIGAQGGAGRVSPSLICSSMPPG
jgi:hypothetical protein